MSKKSHWLIVCVLLAVTFLGCMPQGQPAESEVSEVDEHTEDVQRMEELRIQAVAAIIQFSTTLAPFCTEVALKFDQSTALGCEIVYCDSTRHGYDRIQARQSLMIEVVGLMSRLSIMQVPDDVQPVMSLLAEGLTQHQRMLDAVYLCPGRLLGGMCTKYVSGRNGGETWSDAVRRTWVGHKDGALVKFQQACQSWADVLDAYEIAPSEIGLPRLPEWPLTG